MIKILSILVVTLSLVGCFQDTKQISEQTGEYLKQYNAELYNHPYVKCLDATAQVQYSRYDRSNGYLGVMSIKWYDADGKLLETTYSKHNLSLQSLDSKQIVMLFLPKKDYCNNKG